MKKTLALTMAAVLAAGSLAGCGGGNKPAENTTAAPAATTAAAAETTTAAGTSAETSQEAAASDLSGDITVLVNNAFTNSNEPAINKAADEFMKLNPNVKVTIEGLSGSELISKYTTSAMAGAGPDVVALDNAGWPIDLAAMGLIIPLDDKIAASGNDYLQGPLDSGMYQGQYYSVPWYFNNTGLYYNKTILEDIGVANP
ncbi:MAG: extracellular solute-binding protein, partial [Clostridiaceae bacterium]|nr:extracellular solute-binding protein [Clostridiaceae bacterium]